MKYENIVNEELRIAAISISDLTIEYANAFLSQWESGAKLHTLTLYYDNEADYLVLNKDNPDYTMYLEISEAYFETDEQTRRKIRNEAPYSIGETFDVLDICINKRALKRELEIIEKQSIAVTEGTLERMLFEEILKKNGCSVFSLSVAYSYGLMCGKRVERMKKARAAS